MSALGLVSTLAPYRDEGLLLDFDDGNFSDLLTCQRASTKLYIGEDGLLHTAAIDEPTIETDVMGRKHLLLEGAGTNLCRCSYYQDGDTWTAPGATLTQNVGTAPDGTQTLSRFTRVAESTTYLYPGTSSSISYTSGASYTASIILKLDPGGVDRTVRLRVHPDIYGTSREITLNIKTGAFSANQYVEASNYIALASGFVCIWMTNTATATVSSVPPMIYPGTGFTGGVHVDFWGCDLKVGGFLTSHVITRNAAATRAADNVFIDGARFAGFFNASEGTFAIDAVNYGAGIADSTLMVVDNGTTGQTDQIAVRTSMGGETWRVTPRSAGAGLFDWGLRGGVQIGTRARLAFSYSPSGWAGASSNGTTASSELGVPVGLSRLRLGARGAATPNRVGIYRIIYWPRAMTADELLQKVRL